MNISSLKATQMDLTDAIRAYIEEKLSAMDELRAKGEFMVVTHMEVGKNSQHHHKGPHYFAEIDLEVQGDRLRARAESEDLYAAVDEARDDIKKQLLQRKDRKVSGHRKPRPGKI